MDRGTPAAVEIATGYTDISFPYAKRRIMVTFNRSIERRDSRLGTRTYGT